MQFGSSLDTEEVSDLEKNPFRFEQHARMM